MLKRYGEGMRLSLCAHPREEEIKMATVLVIDDELTYLDFLAKKLRHDGHEVQTAPDGDEARQIGRPHV